MIGPCGSGWSVTGVLRMRTDACSKCNVRIYKVPQYAKDLARPQAGNAQRYELRPSDLLRLNGQRTELSKKAQPLVGAGRAVG